MSKPEKIHVLNKKVELLQLENGFRTSIDSVLLAASCPAVDSENILDMGCGVGSALFCVLKRLPAVSATGLDWDEEALALARENAALNECADRAVFVQDDIRHFDVETPAARFDHIICNPPYLEQGTHLASPSEQKAMAHGHQQQDISLKDWIEAASRLLKPRGSISFIYRADASVTLLQLMGRRFGAYEVFPLWPKEGLDAKRVIIRARKDRKSPSIMHHGLVLHQDDGQYTVKAEHVLRDGQSLF